MSAKPFDKGMRRAAAMVLAGLSIEAVSFSFQHPTAFLLFAIGGGALIGIGMLTFLYRVAS